MLVIVQKMQPDASTMLPMSGPYSNEQNFHTGSRREPHYFELEDVLAWTETAALPLLPDEYATNVFESMRRFPNLGTDDKEGWRARPYREFDATNHKEYMEFTEDPKSDWWPVYKGASFGIWQPDTSNTMLGVYRVLH